MTCCVSVSCLGIKSEVFISFPSHAVKIVASPQTNSLLSVKDEDSSKQINLILNDLVARFWCSSSGEF